MNVLLTGARGFTGLAFTQLAQSLGHSVSPIGADLRDVDALRRAVLDQQSDTVLHLAGVSFPAHAQPEEFIQTHVQGTLNLLDALSSLPQPPKRVVLASSGTVYGNSQDGRFSESSPTLPIGAYAQSKLAMEEAALNHSSGLPIVIARPFNYTGPGQAGHFLIPKLVDHFARRSPTIALGNLAVEREFNDVQMVCSAYLALLEGAPSGQIFNICTGVGHSLTQILEELSRLTAHTIEVHINPLFVRANDPERIVGNPQKLEQLFSQLAMPWPAHSLSDTLARMLAAATK